MAKWWDVSWNPVSGCTHSGSPGCDNCWAKQMNDRFYDIPFSEIRFHPSRLDEPLRWRKPRRIFVCSMGDLFHDDVLTRWIDDIVLTMRCCPQHTFMILTKRPERMIEYYISRESFEYPFCLLPNLWLGVSVEDQATADQRIPILLQTPAAKRFVSVEPMLSSIDLTYYLTGHEDNGVDPEMKRPVGCCLSWTPPLDWVIVGSESGPRRRPCNLDWIKSLRDQCVAANVPFFCKQAIINGKLVKMPPIDGKVWGEGAEG